MYCIDISSAISADFVKEALRKEIIESAFESLAQTDYYTEKIADDLSSYNIPGTESFTKEALEECLCEEGVLEDVLSIPNSTNISFAGSEDFSVNLEFNVEAEIDIDKLKKHYSDFLLNKYKQTEADELLEEDDIVIE